MNIFGSAINFLGGEAAFVIGFTLIITANIVYIFIRMYNSKFGRKMSALGYTNIFYTLYVYRNIVKERGGLKYYYAIICVQIGLVAVGGGLMFASIYLEH